MDTTWVARRPGRKLAARPGDNVSLNYAPRRPITREARLCFGYSPRRFVDLSFAQRLAVVTRFAQLAGDVEPYLRWKRQGREVAFICATNRLETLIIDACTWRGSGRLPLEAVDANE